MQQYLASNEISENNIKKIIMNNNDDLKLINTDPLQGMLVFNSKEVEIGMTPFIFKKKINDTCKTIPLNTPNDLGHIRHFPATTKE